MSVGSIGMFEDTFIMQSCIYNLIDITERGCFCGGWPYSWCGAQGSKYATDCTSVTRNSDPRTPHSLGTNFPLMLNNDALRMA